MQLSAVILLPELFTLAPNRDVPCCSLEFLLLLTLEMEGKEVTQKGVTVGPHQPALY